MRNLEELVSILCSRNYTLERWVEELESIVFFENMAINPSPLHANINSTFAPIETPRSNTHLEDTAAAISKVVPEIYELINNRQTLDGDSRNISTFLVTSGSQHQGKLVDVLKKGQHVSTVRYVSGGDKFKKKTFFLEPASTARSQVNPGLTGQTARPSGPVPAITKIAALAPDLRHTALRLHITPHTGIFATS